MSVESNVNVSEFIGDGGIYTGARLPSRTISIICGYRKNGRAEKAKNQLYRICRPKNAVTVRCISPLHDVFIIGYCSSISTPPNNKPMVTQIAIVCPDPYFKDTDGGNVQMYGSAACWEWIKDGTAFNSVEFGNAKTAEITAINYGGDTECGCKFIFTAKKACQNPKIINIKTKETLSFTLDLQAGDVFTVNTRDGYKAATLERDGTVTDCIGKLDLGSTFLKLAVGENKFKIAVDGADVHGIDVYCRFDILIGGI